ncbi:MAG: response regulator, partial [Limisphaerales bacterium]
RALIVEDNAASRSILERRLARWGMTSLGTGSSAEALKLLNSGEEFDVALLDAQMPGTDGFSLAAEIHQLPRTELLPILLLVPLGVRLEPPPSVRIPFINYVSKPVKTAQLFEAIHRTLTHTKAPAEKPVMAPASAPPRKPAARNLQVLLCDDNSINQKVAARILQQLNYKSDIAANGVEALDALDKKRYDLVFMDVMMPEMDGLDATREIRRRQKAARENYQSRIVIIAMTAQAMQGDREKCLKAGMDDYLAKPIRPADVGGMIDKWFAGAASPPAAAARQTPPAGETPPIEMDRLTELADGDKDTLRELVDLFTKQTTRQLSELEEAARANKPEELRHLAHSCKGASATMGMGPLAAIFFELEKMGRAGVTEGAAPLLVSAAAEFKRVEDFLASTLANSPRTPAVALS